MSSTHGAAPWEAISWSTPRPRDSRRRRAWRGTRMAASSSPGRDPTPAPPSACTPESSFPIPRRWRSARTLRSPPDRLAPPTPRSMAARSIPTAEMRSLSSRLWRVARCQSPIRRGGARSRPPAAHPRPCRPRRASPWPAASRRGRSVLPAAAASRAGCGVQRLGSRARPVTAAAESPRAGTRGCPSLRCAAIPLARSASKDRRERC